MAPGRLAEDLRRLGLRKDQEVFVRGMTNFDAPMDGCCIIAKGATVIAETVTIRD